MKQTMYASFFTLANLFLLSGCGQHSPQELGKTAAMPESGYRGINIALDGDRSFYISQEDMVDVILVFAKRAGISGAEKEAVAVTLMKKMRVLGVAQSEENPANRIIRLQAGPDEAQHLEAAARTGNIWLSLRKKGDVEDNPMYFSAWGDVLNPGLRPLTSVHLSTGDRVLPPCGSINAAALAAVRGLIPESFPGISVSISSDKIGGIRPKDRIDVLATIDAAGAAGSKKQKRTITLLQNIFVIDSRPSRCHPGQSILFLALNFKQVQEAALAWDTAEIQILSRNSADTERHTMQSASLSVLTRD